MPSRARYGIASCFLVALLSASAVSPAVASAQGLSAQDEANARFQTGLKYYDNHDFESARLAFKQAYAVLQKPSILLNLALSELYSNHPLDAIVHFEEYMRDPSTPGDKREKAKKSLEEAMKKTAHLQIRTAADAQVSIDGHSIPPPYTMVHVMPGSHAVEARLSSKSKSANIDPKPGDTVPIDLTFEGEPTPPPTPPIDPSTNNTNTSQPPNNPPGTDPPPVSTDSFWGFRSIGGLALLAVGAGAIVGGIVFKSEASDEQSRVDELGAGLPADACAASADARCSQLADAVDARDSASTRGTIFLVAGTTLAVVGAAGIISALVLPHRHATTTGFRPILHPRQLGFSFAAHF